MEHHENEPVKDNHLSDPEVEMLWRALIPRTKALLRGDHPPAPTSNCLQMEGTRPILTAMVLRHRCTVLTCRVARFR